jgi:hypothetical protein
MAEEPSFIDRAINWAVSGEDSARVPFIDPKTNRAVTNVAADPTTGRVTRKSPEISAEEAFSNLKNNWSAIKGLEAFRGMVRGVADIPQIPSLMESVNRGVQGEGMSPQQYYNKFLALQRGPASTALMARGVVLPNAPRKMTDAQIREVMRKDRLTANAMANMFSYQTPDGGLEFDSNRMIRSITQDPAGVFATLAGAGSGTAAGIAGKLGKVANAAQQGSRLRTVAGASKKYVFDPTAKALKITSAVANPFVPLAAAAITSGPVRDVATFTKNKVMGRQAIYRPDFMREWTPFKARFEDHLRGTGMTDDVIASPAAQQRIFDMFNQQTNGKFADPFTAKAKKDFADNGMDPADYAAPHIGKIVEDTINAKRGVTPAVMQEAKLKAAGASSVTRSAATGEGPGFLFRSQEGPARTATEGQMSQALSDRFAPDPGTRVPTHRDIADDFIDTQLERRNAFGQSYAEAAANDGIYRNPNAFVDQLDRRTEALLRLKGIDPSELATNPEAFRNANAAIGSSRTNISNHGASIPKIQEMVFGKRYTYDRQFGWVDDGGNPAPISYQQALNSDPVIAGKIAAAPPPPVNRLSLENIEIERRSLNAAAQKAYEDGTRNNGDFRNYNAITARIDALDDTAITMGRDFTGDAAKAIPALQQARSQYRGWRENGIGSQNPVVSTAAQQVVARSTFDPATGRYTFNDTPGSRNVISQNFEGNLVGGKTASPPGLIGSGATATNPAETYTALSNALSPNGQNALGNLVRAEGYGRPGATVDDINQLNATYAGQGVNLLTPEQQNFLKLNLEARPTTSPTNIPAPDPFKFNPFAAPEGGVKGDLVSRASQIVSPFIKGGIGYALGTAIGGPNLGYMLASAGPFQGPLRQNIKNLRSVATEQYGAPNFRINIPNPQAPLSLGAAYGSQVAQDRGEQRLAREDAAFFNPPPPPAQTPKAPPPVDYSRGDAAFFGPPPEADKIFAPPQEQNDDQIFAKPQAYGGRTAYKTGGKVNGIEPLVAALMSKAKMAKKTSNKATEPLLNERDDAIANALAVAQKAI